MPYWFSLVTFGKHKHWKAVWDQIDGFLQERHNSIANAMELRLSCTNQSICLFSDNSLYMLLWPIYFVKNKFYNTSIILSSS